MVDTKGNYIETEDEKSERHARAEALRALVENYGFVLAEGNIAEAALSSILGFIEFNMLSGLSFINTLLLGRAGLGKTESIKGIAKKHGWGFKSLSFAQLTELDVLGLPRVDEEGRTTYAANTLLPDAKRDGDVGILLIDEITSAKANMQAAAFQLLDTNRGFGSYKLPEKWMIVCAGNGEDDGGQFNQLTSAFIGRCCCFRVKPDFRSWKMWAQSSTIGPDGKIKQRVVPEVIAFLNENPQYLHILPDETSDALKREGQQIEATAGGGWGIHPEPRSWARLSDIIYAYQQRMDTDTLAKVIPFLAAGNIGGKLARLFGEYYKFKSQIITVDDILSGVAPVDISHMNASIKYMTAQHIISQISYMVRNEIGEEANASLASMAMQPGVLSDALTKKLKTIFEWLGQVSGSHMDMASSVAQDIAETTPVALSFVFEDILAGAVDGDEFAKQNPYLSEFIDKAMQLNKATK